MVGAAKAGTNSIRADEACSVRVEDSGRTFACAAQDTLLASALRAGLGLAYECSSGGCGSCKVELVSGNLESLRVDAPGLTARDRARNRWLACQSRVRANCVIRFNEDPAYVPLVPPRRQSALLDSLHPLTHDLWEFRFKTASKATFLPGQYALMYLPGLTQTRAYSMANIANADGAWHFQIKRVPKGAASAILFERFQLGDRVELDGPYSIAYLREDSPRDIVCIAGGSGLAPMLSIVRGAAQCKALSGRSIQLFYGGREPSDIVDASHFGKLPGLGTRIHYRPVISDGKSEAAKNWTGPTGFVHQFVEQHLKNDFSRFEFYIAGPPLMVDAARRLLIIQNSVPLTQVHYDRFF